MDCQILGLDDVAVPIKTQFDVKTLMLESKSGNKPNGLSFIIFATSKHTVKNSGRLRKASDYVGL